MSLSRLRASAIRPGCSAGSSSRWECTTVRPMRRSTWRKVRALGTQEGHTQVPPVTPLVVSGGVWTSAADMAKYLGFLLGGGRSGAQQLLEPRPGTRCMVSAWAATTGSVSCAANALRQYTGAAAAPPRRGFGFGCVFTYCRQANAGFAAMFNRATSAGYGIGERLLDQLLSARFGPRQPRVPLSSLAPIRLTQDQMQQMAGSWIGAAARRRSGLPETGSCNCIEGRTPRVPACGHRRRSTFHCGHRWRGCDVPLPCGDGHAAGVPGMQQRRGWPGPERSHRWAHCRRRPIGNPGWDAIALTNGANHRCSLCWSNDTAGCTSMASAWLLRWSQDCCSPAMAKRWIFAPSRHGATCACGASRPWARGDGGMPRAHPRRPRPSML